VVMKCLYESFQNLGKHTQNGNVPINLQT